MNRRQFLTAAGASVTAATAGCIDTITDPHPDPPDTDAEADTTTPTATVETVAEEDVPEEVAAVKPLASAFTDRVAGRDAIREPRVGINPENGDLTLHYKSAVGSAEALKRQLHDIADLYAQTAKEGDHDPVTLAIVTGKVQALVPKPSVKAYNAGRLKQDAFFETVEVMGV